MTEIPTLSIAEPDPKHWYESRGVWGSLAAVVASLAGMFGVEVDAGALSELALQAAALCGGLVALWGRLKAAKPIAPRLLPRE